LRRFFSFFVTCVLIFSISFASLSAEKVTFTISKKLLNAVEKKYGVAAKKRMIALAKLINSLKGKSEKEKVVKINSFFNQVPYVTDKVNWGKNDYWATPIEFLGKFGGDCEDYAIAKFLTLVKVGVPAKKLYITYVKITYNGLNQAHMVLAYYPKPRAVPYILDNFNKKILLATKRKDLKPVYSFNAESLFLAKQRGLGKKVPGGNQRNKKWLSFLSRLNRGEI
jgi:predicted transglutaminase-like cysteine proteinase